MNVLKLIFNKLNGQIFYTWNVKKIYETRSHIKINMSLKHNWLKTHKNLLTLIANMLHTIYMYTFFKYINGKAWLASKQYTEIIESKRV